MPGSWIAMPEANKAITGSAAWTVGAEVSGYGAARGLTLVPEDVTKATPSGGSVAYQITLPSPEEIIAVILINTSFGGKTATLTNGAGMTPKVITCPNPADRVQQNAIFDLRGLSSRNDDVWTVTVAGLTGAGAIGSALVIAEWLEPRFRWGYEIEEIYPTIVHRNSYRKRFNLRIPVRVRRFGAVADWAEDRNLMREHRRACGGPFTPFPLVADEDDADDVFLVQYLEDPVTEQHNFHDGSFSSETVDGEVEQRYEVEEVNAGLSPS